MPPILHDIGPKNIFPEFWGPNAHCLSSPMLMFTIASCSDDCTKICELVHLFWQWLYFYTFSYPMGTRRLIDVVSKLFFGRDVADSEYNVSAAYRQWRWDTDQVSTANQRRAIALQWSTFAVIRAQLFIELYHFVERMTWLIVATGRDVYPTMAQTSLPPFGERCIGL